METGYKFLPFPATQRLQAPLPCEDGLLLFELSATMYSSWAMAFGQYIRLHEHSTLLSGFLYVLQRAIDIGAPVVLETVVDKVEFWSIAQCQLSPSLQPRSYRLWVPMTHAISAAFCTECYASFEDQEPPSKRIRAQPPSSAQLPAKISTKDDLAAMLRIYHGGRMKIANITLDDTDEFSQRPESHILNILAAKTYFGTEEVADKHQRQRLCVEQSNIASYISYGTNQTASFFPDEKIQNSNLVRYISTGTGGLLKKASDLLQFLLPHFVPPKQLVIDKLRVVLDSVGEPWDPSLEEASLDDLVRTTKNSPSSKCFVDPIEYSPIQVADSGTIDTTSAAAASLDEAYPVASRLRNKNIARINGAKTISADEVVRVMENVVQETQTLLASKVPGVPEVYHDILKESSEQLLLLRDNKDKTLKNMFFQLNAPPGGYTGFGYRMLRLLVGASNCLRLFETQSMLMLLLYARHFIVTANRPGIGGGLTIVCGPPDTGKSRACEQFLSSVSRKLFVENDGQSEKAYTAGSLSTDLRCMYQDEVKDLLVPAESASDGASSAAIKVQQTLLSRGYVRYKRLTQNIETNEFEADSILIVQRVMMVGCTNAVSSIPPAIQSRACIVPLVRQPKDALRRVSVNALVASRDNPAATRLEKTFMKSTQLLSALQGRFWQAEAFGAIPLGIDTNAYTVFQSLLENEHGRHLLPARRFLDIKETAEGLMVLDLVSLWYSRGFGAK